MICKILFQEAEMRTAQWIIGVIDENQLCSPINGLIEVKNYYNKTIGKVDIKDIIPLKEDESVVIDRIGLAINRSVSIANFSNSSRS